MADPTLKIIITATDATKGVINAIAKQIGALAKTATSQVKMAIPKITIPKSEVQALKTKGILDFTSEVNKMEKAYIASLLRMAKSTEDFEAIIKEIEVPKKLFSQMLLPIPSIEKFVTPESDFKFQTLGIADLYKTQLALIEKDKKIKEQALKEEEKQNQQKIKGAEQVAQEEIKYNNLVISNMIKSGATVESVYQAIAKSGEISATDRLKHIIALSDREINVENEKVNNLLNLRDETNKKWIEAEESSFKKARDLKEQAIINFDTLQQKETANFLNQKLKEAKTVQDVEALKLKTVGLSGNERLKFETALSTKVIKIQEKEVKEQAKQHEETLKKWKGNILGGVNVALRSITGIFAGLGMASTALATRAGSDWVRSYIPIANIQARFRAVGRIFEGIFKSFTQIVFGFYKFLWNITTSVLSSIANLFKRTFQVASLAVTAFFGKALYDLANFEHAIQAVMTLIPQATETTFARAFEGVSEIVRKLPVDFLDTAKGLLEIVSTGFEDLNDALIIAKEGAIGATAGLTQNSTAISGLLTVLSAYNLEASESSRINDLMFRTVDKSRASYTQLAQEMGFFVGIARNANLTLEETFATFSLLTRVIRPEQAGILTARLIEAVTVPAKEAENMMRAFDILPFRFDELGNRIFIGMEKFFLKLAGMNLPTQVLRAMFPDERQFRAITSIISQGTEKIREMFGSFTETADASQQAMEKMMNTLPNIFKMIWENLKDVGVSLVQPFSEGFRIIAKKARDFVINFSETISYITKAGGFDRIKNSFKEIADSLNIIFSKDTFVAMFEAVEPVILRILDYIKQIPNIFGTIKPKIKESFIWITNEFIPNSIAGFKTIGDTLLGIVDILLHGLKLALPILDSFVATYNAMIMTLYGTGHALIRERRYLMDEINRLQKTMNEEDIREAEIQARKLSQLGIGTPTTSTEPIDILTNKMRQYLDITKELGMVEYINPKALNESIDKIVQLRGEWLTTHNLLKLYKGTLESIEDIFPKESSLLSFGEAIQKLLTPLERYKRLLGRLPKFKIQYEFEEAQRERQKFVDEFKNRLLLPESPFGLLTARKFSPKEKQQMLRATGIERFKLIDTKEIERDLTVAKEQLQALAETGKYSFEQLQKSALDLRQQLVDTFGAGSKQVRNFEQDMRNLNLISKDLPTTIKDVFSAEIFETQLNANKKFAESLVDIYKQIGNQIGDVFSKLYSGEKVKFGEFAREMLAMINRMMVQALIQLGISKFMGIIFPTPSPIPLPTAKRAHKGGMITEDMTRFHSGGLGLFAQDERPAILQTGEGVLSRQGIRTLGMLNKGEVSRQEQPIININMVYKVDSLFPVIDSDADKKVDAILVRKSNLFRNILKQAMTNQVRG